MAENGKVAGLIAAFAIGMPALIDFHLYSSFLSSPYTTQKFAAENEEDAAQVWGLFRDATTAGLILTVATGGALAYGYGEWWPLWVALLSFAFGAIWMWYEYKEALAGNL